MARQSRLPISQVSDDSTEEVASNAKSFRAAKLAAVGLTLLIAGSALVLHPGRDSRGAALDLATNKAGMPADHSEFSERFGSLLAGRTWDQIAEIKECIHGNACPDIGTEQDEMRVLRTWYTTASVEDRTAHESQTDQMMKGSQPGDYSEFSERFGSLLAGKTWDQIAEIKDCIHGNACPDIGTEQAEMRALRSWYTTASVEDRTAHESQTDQMMNGQSATAATVEQEHTCSNDGGNCYVTKCCTSPGSFCFKKNDDWASCNKTCNEKMMWNSEKQIFEEQLVKVWDCSVLEPTSSPAQPVCTANGESCLTSKCCSEPGMTCFKKNEGWASCNQTCNEKMLWNQDTQQFEEQATKVWDCAVLGDSESQAVV